ncbi:MAG TPA: ribulose-phosphate 3-epimerase [Atribacteraceae bacterium]|nr:ribulose-phosphate 3-epimerase [Atribacteraceae bacterium]
MARLAPSILSCDFSRLKEQLQAAQRGGAEIIHLDVMDGHFVPNMTFGPLIVEAVRKILPDGLLDVHLMVEEPAKYINDFTAAGADFLSFHAETVPDFDRVINLLRSSGLRPAVALCPGTPVSAIENVLHKLDMVLLMTVNPGFGGQRFIPGMERKISELKKSIQQRGLSVEIEIDGGIQQNNIEFLASRGATIIVAGSLVFSDHDRIEATVRSLTERIRPF